MIAPEPAAAAAGPQNTPDPANASAKATPSAPAEPAGPPTPPTEPVKPGEPAADPGKPTEPAKPGEPAKAGESSEGPTWKLPEGMPVDESLLADFTTATKDLGLSPEQGQALVDLYSKRMKADWDAIENQRAAWEAELRGDQELGGVNYEKSIAAANKALDRYFDPSIVQLFKDLRLETHPGLLRTCKRIGERISEDPLPRGGDPANQRSPLDVIYTSK